MLAMGLTPSWAEGEGEMVMQEAPAQSVREQRAAVLGSMEISSDALMLHDKPAQEDDALPRRKRLCPNWRALQPASPWTQPVLIDHETCDVVLGASDEDIVMDEASSKAAGCEEPRTPSRSPVETYGTGVDEQLLSCFLGSYKSQHSLLAKAQAARTQRLAAIATNFGGSFAAHAAAKQIVKRSACASCGGFARCMDCPDWQLNAVDSYIECPDRERPVHRTAVSTRHDLNAPASCVLPG